MLERAILSDVTTNIISRFFHRFTARDGCLQAVLRELAPLNTKLVCPLPSPATQPKGRDTRPITRTLRGTTDSKAECHTQTRLVTHRESCTHNIALTNPRHGVRPQHRSVAGLLACSSIDQARFGAGEALPSVERRGDSRRSFRAHRRRAANDEAACGRGRRWAAQPQAQEGGELPVAGQGGGRQGGRAARGASRERCWCVWDIGAGREIAPSFRLAAAPAMRQSDTYEANLPCDPRLGAPTAR